MKVQVNANKADLFADVQKQKTDIWKNQKEKNISERSPVQVSISNEGMEQYRSTLAQKETVEEGKECHALVNHGWELSSKVNEINRSKKDLSVKGQADSILEAYASLYADILQGYEDGTRVVYGESGENRPLTKEEDLARLSEAYESHVKAFDKFLRVEQENQRVLENTIRNTVWGRTSSRAQAYLSRVDEKKEKPEYIPDNVSKPMLEAGKSFLEKFPSLKIKNSEAVSSILLSIEVW